MPGMDGFELQHRLADSPHKIPIIFITAHGDEEAPQRLLAAGAVDYLRKPFGEDTLLNAVKAVLQK
jgi:two-component system response regulator FixJ